MMKLGMLLALPEAWEPEKNMQKLEKMAEDAAAKGVDLLMTCEGYLDGYCSAKTGIAEKLTGELRERFESMAQPNDSIYLKRASEICKKHHMGLIFGLMTLEDGKIYNTAVLFDVNGEEIGRYHKTHLYAHDVNYDPGHNFPVFDTRWGKIGMLICADRRWPEAARSLRVQGAEMLLIPTWGFHGPNNTCFMRTRAYENECWLAFCHPLLSFICNPKGEVEAGLQSSEEGILVHDIDPTRCGHDMYDMRRTDIYVL